MRSKPRRADEHLRWLRANGHDLAGLTGSDYRALEAIAACWMLRCYCDFPAVTSQAVAFLLVCLQDKYHHLAKELIAYAMDWSDRARIWPEVEAAYRRPSSRTVPFYACANGTPGCNGFCPVCRGITTRPA